MSGTKVDAVVPARRGHLDGLRALAVGVVVAFHTGIDRLVGGFIGVDVFFVLSGYLVTEVLLRSFDANGRIGFGRFYSRRVRRLLPAAIIVLLVTGAVFSAVDGLIGRAALADDLRAALLYVANWHFIGTSADYFAAESPSPVRHMWSLAVEEQFYVVWPMLLAGLLWLVPSSQRGRRIAAGVVVAAGSVSLVAALAIRDNDLERAYYGTDTRAYQLLAGATLALLPGIVRWASTRRRESGLLALVGLVAIVVVSSYRVDVDPITRGMLATVASLAVIIGLDAAPRSLAARTLSLGPIVAIGQISYGVYLWHWPVVLLIDDLVEVSTPSRAMLTILVSVGLASASHRLIEEPIVRARLLDRIRWPLAVAGVSMSVVAALVVVPILTDVEKTGAHQSVALFESGWGTPAPSYADLYQLRLESIAETATCVDSAPEDCTAVSGSGPHVLVLGDSVAESLTPGFVAMAEERDLTLSLITTRGCPWQRDYAYPWMAKDIADRCTRTKKDAYDRVIPALDPDVIVLVSASLVPGEPVRPDTEESERLWRTTERSLAELADGHRQIVLVEPLPFPATPADDGPLVCMADATFVEECRFVTSSPPTWLTVRQREIAESTDGVTGLDIGRLVCPYLPICDPIVDGRPVWWDNTHIMPGYAATMGPALGAALEDVGVLSG